MRILFESLLIMLLVGSSSSPLLAEHLPAFATLPNKDFVLILLGALIAFEALYLAAENIRTQRKGEQLRVSSTLSSVQRDDAIAKVEDLSKQVEDLKAEKEQLQIALDSSQSSNNENNTKPQDDNVIGFLSLLQEKGRFIDFIMGDIAPYNDAQVGAAARILHHGCNAVFKDYISISPIFEGEEGQATSLPSEYDKHSFRLIGNLQGEAPFKGTVLHCGWTAERVELPRPIQTNSLQQSKVITPAEIEVS